MLYYYCKINKEKGDNKKMKKSYGILFNRKTGKIFKCMEGYVSAMMNMWALNGNVSPLRDFVVFNEDGIISFYCEGRKDDMPKVHKDMEGKHIDKLCEGLLESLNGE